MALENTHTLSLIKTYKYSWANVLKIYFDLNVEQITSCEITEEGNLLINGNEYKLDVSNYTGHTERYIFFNPINGRIAVETLGKIRVYKVEVDLLDSE